MINVWQCDHCTRTGNIEEISIHEHKCVFNPVNKKCWCCKHRFDDGAPISGFTNGCRLGHSCLDVEDGDIICNDFKQ